MKSVFKESFDIILKHVANERLDLSLKFMVRFCTAIPHITAYPLHYYLRRWYLSLQFNDLVVVSMMMHEVGSDSNGEAAYDFVADAKKDTSGISTSNAAPSNAPHEASFALGQTFGPNSLVSPPPVVFLTTATAGPKPSYEFPPGSQDTRGAPPSLPRHPGISTFSPQFIPPQNPLSRFPGPAPVQGVADYLGALSGPKQGGGSFGGSGSVASVRPSGPSSTG